MNWVKRVLCVALSMLCYAEITNLNCSDGWNAEQRVYFIWKRPLRLLKGSIWKYVNGCNALSAKNRIQIWIPLKCIASKRWKHIILKGKSYV